MTPQPPSLSQQIEAVAWAKTHVDATGKAAHMRAGEIEEMRRRLDAAAETLRHLDFMRETLP
jgi:hypothetical protein